jgi:hypothetical protein
VPDEADHFRALDGILDQLQVDFERRRHTGDRRELGPIAAVAQDRRLAPGRPRPTPVRRQ